MRDLLRPVLVAPMAGGPSTPALVIAAGRAGAIGFLAAGYKTPEAVEDELRAVGDAGPPYGLNIFVPRPVPVDVEPLERYRRLLQPEADRYEVDLPPLRLADDDWFAEKVELAVAYRVPLVSFTFGVPPAEAVERLRAAGCRVLITVTGAGEAARALTVGPDALIAQAGTAGGHSATTDPAGYRGTATAAEVLAAVRAVAGEGAAAVELAAVRAVAGEGAAAVELAAARAVIGEGAAAVELAAARRRGVPVVAAGGVASAADVAGLLAAGAAAVQCGTAFLLADEAGTRAPQRAAMLSGDYRETVVTRAFTGQPARALRNRFTDAYTAAAPIGYPAVHHLTAPIRAAAARRGDPGALNLWAGTGHAAARPGPVADLIARLTPQASLSDSTER